MIIEALRKFKVKPNEAVMIGDSLKDLQQLQQKLKINFLYQIIKQTFNEKQYTKLEAFALHLKHYFSYWKF